MNYVWQKDQGEVDSWLANMDEATMEKSIGEAAAALKVCIIVFIKRILHLTTCVAKKCQKGH